MDTNTWRQKNKTNTRESRGPIAFTAKCLKAVKCASCGKTISRGEQYHLMYLTQNGHYPKALKRHITCMEIENGREYE